MKFGENSKKAASGLIVVMLVAVIALAGTAIYVTLDKTVLTEDGYAMPGSTITFTSKTIGTNDDREVSTTMTIAGYGNNNYFIFKDGKLGYQFDDMNGIDDEVGLSVKDVKVNIPGLGNVDAKEYSMTDDDSSMAITVALHGLVVTVTVKGQTVTEELTIKDSNITLGDYKQISEQKFVNSNKSITLFCHCKSTNDRYLCEVYTGTSGYKNVVYFADSSGIPQNAGNRCTVEGAYSEATLNISNGKIVSIEYDGMTYTPAR